jgi:hypothetical protein
MTSGWFAHFAEHAAARRNSSVTATLQWRDVSPTPPWPHTGSRPIWPAKSGQLSFASSWPRSKQL